MTILLQRGILPNIPRIVSTYPSQTVLQNSRGWNTPKFILRGHHYPDTKTRQGHYKKGKLQDIISEEYRCKNPQHNISKSNSTIYKRIIYHDQVEFIPGMQRWFSICKSITVIHPLNKRKDKNHMIISNDVEKVFDKIQHPFMIKNCHQSWYRGNIYQNNKTHI